MCGGKATMIYEGLEGRKAIKQFLTQGVTKNNVLERLMKKPMAYLRDVKFFETISPFVDPASLVPKSVQEILIPKTVSDGFVLQLTSKDQLDWKKNIKPQAEDHDRVIVIAEASHSGITHEYWGDRALEFKYFTLDYLDTMKSLLFALSMQEHGQY